MNQVKKFDFNVGKILQNWTIKDAIREIIANALDEQKLSATKSVIIQLQQPNRLVIADWGRGLQTKHLTQNENPEKYNNPHLIGLFGIGLKDALATLSRHEVAVKIISPFLTINHISLTDKSDFNGIKTLHAWISTQSTTHQGTRFEIEGVSTKDIAAAQHYFLQFRNLVCLHENKYGQIVAKGHPDDPGSIFINGLEVNLEPNFKFHYNITNKDQKIRRALNRERTNVGRSAYADRIKKIISHCDSVAINNELRNQFDSVGTGHACEEVTWIEVQKHLFQHLDTTDIVMVTQQQLMDKAESVDSARQDGKQIVVVSDRLYQSLPDTNLDSFMQNKYETFAYDFVEKEELEAEELKVFAQTKKIFSTWGVGEPWIQNINIKISNSMPGRTVGMWQPSEQTIIMKRSQLATLSLYAGTLIHEWIHAQTNYPDLNRDFEIALTESIGRLVKKIILG